MIFSAFLGERVGLLARCDIRKRDHDPFLLLRLRDHGLTTLFVPLDEVRVAPHRWLDAVGGEDSVIARRDAAEEVVATFVRGDGLEEFVAAWRLLSVSMVNVFM